MTESSRNDTAVSDVTTPNPPDLGVFRSEAVQFLKRALEGQQQCSEMYAREIQLLRKEVKSRDSGTASMVAFLQKRMKAVETEHAEVSAKLQTFLAKESEHIAAVDADCAGKVAAAKRQAVIQVEELKRKLADAETQLAALATFRDQRASVEGEIERLKRELAARETTFQQQTELMERQHRAELVKIRQSCLAEIASVHETSRRMAENDLNAESKRLRIERTRLHSELQFHEAQTLRLVGENEKLQKQLRELREELDIQNEKESHYAARGAQQQRKIRELSRKVETAENDAVRQALNGKKEVEKVQKSVESELAALRIEAAECRSLATLREKEMQQMKQLAGAILSQRTQIERFFHEAVREVRAQRQKETKEKPRRRTTGNDYLDLDPSERDRILHLMFARLKGRRPNPTQIPSHSFQTTTKTRLPPPYAEPEFQFVTEKDH